MPDTIIPGPEVSHTIPAALSLDREAHASGSQTFLKKCFSFPVLMGALLVVANYAIESALSTEADTWWHMKYGESILQTGHWPTGDVYSFTAHGVFRMAFEWGGSVLMAIAYQLGGLRGLDLLLIVLTSTVIVLLYYYAFLRSGNAKASFLATAVALELTRMCFTLRPQLLGFIFLLLTLIFLERYRQGRQMSLWVLPPIFLLWINCHASWAMGLFFFGVYWVSGLVGFSRGGLIAERWTPKQRVHLALVFLLSVLALLINPYGTQLVAYPFKVAFSMPVEVANVQEWLPLPFTYWQSKMLLILLLGFIAAVVALRPSFRLEDIGLFLFATYSALAHFRFVILFAVLVAPMIAVLIARWAPPYEPGKDKHWLNATLMGLAIIGMAAFFPTNSTLNKNLDKTYPMGALNYLQQHSVPGFTFNDYGFGGYMIWTLGPSHPVFIDGRADLYEETGVFSDYLHISNLKPGTLAVLQAYGIRSCLIGPESPLSTLLRARPEWNEVYKDNFSAIFVRGPYNEMGASTAKQ